MSVAANLETIQKNVRAHGGDPDKLVIVGAAKFQPVERIREALSAGLRDLGDNQLQAGEALRQQLAETVRWHFIGHIQSRKAKGLIDYDLIHSLDRLKVAEALNAALLADNRRKRVLIEVNIGDEPSKSGIGASELPAFLAALASFRQLEPVGLMCLPPPLQPVENRRPFFAALRQLAHVHQLGELSMGTSDDYPIAVEEGATMIRVGTCLFGERAR